MARSPRESFWVIMERPQNGTAQKVKSEQEPWRGQKSGKWSSQKASFYRAESYYFHSSGVWLLLQNVISVLDCCSLKYFCTGFGSAD